MLQQHTGNATTTYRECYNSINNNVRGWLPLSPDVDECASSQNQCQQLCINVAGSYNCGCFYGFRLDSDRATCNQGNTVRW